MNKLQIKLYSKLLTLMYKSKSGHIGSSLSCLDILSQTILFEMKKNDQIILSKGHGAPALYIVLNQAGKISDKKLDTFNKDGTTLPAHPPRNLSKLVPFQAGSLGHGLSLSSGIALANIYKYRIKKTITIPRIFCLMSDGECNEGQVWEAAQFASKKELSNLIVMIDKNGIQAFGKTQDVLGDSTTLEKWKAFGFETYLADGHNYLKIKKAFQIMNKSKSKKPKVIIFKTVKGNGVSFMENTIEWHYKTLTEDQYKSAMKEIKENK